jgi:hypothetical protein
MINYQNVIAATFK